MQEKSSQELRIEEGIVHGPFAPPELDEHPESARWLLDSVGGDLRLYNYLLLRDGLEKDRIDEVISPEAFQAHNVFLQQAINIRFAQIAKTDLTKVKADRTLLGKT